MTFAPKADLAAGTYRLWVRGITRDGRVGQWSSMDEFTIFAPPTITHVSDQLFSRPTIGFTAIPGVSKYDVWIASTKALSKPRIHATTATSDPVFQASGDLTSGSYIAWVRGVAADGSFGDWSAVMNFSAGLAPQFTSTLPTTLPVNSSISLSWTQVSGVDHYNIWITIPNAPPQEMRAEDIPRFFQQLPATEQGQYRFWVRGVAQDGRVGRWSDPIVISVQGKVGEINTSFTADTIEHPFFTWKPVKGAAKYEARIDEIRNNVTNIVHDSNIAKTSFTPAESLPLGTYRIKIRPISLDGTIGEWSEPVVYSSIQIPQLVPVLSRLDPDVLLEWRPVDGVTSYDVVLQNLSTGEFVMQQRSVASTTVKVLSPKLADGRFQWWVRANGPDKWSAAGIFEVSRKPHLTLSATYSLAADSKAVNWTPVSGAGHYDVWISNSRGALVLRDPDVMTNSFNHGTTLPIGSYRVWIRAISTSNTVGPWSSPGIFAIV
ncbi:MAG: hypothetical protein O2856_16330 [Planctomycetota bacterium]|nr:hypothetical protein [Planctomycetota bacterium]